jgi:23S rRNA (guanosine2251-2'-O)-methyltransferase
VFTVGGRRTVAEAIRAGRARRVFAARGARSTEGLQALLEEAGRAGVGVEWVGGEEIDGFGVADHQGVVAVVAPPSALDDGAFANARFEPDAVVVALDGITDPQNLGACARAAEAAGAAMLVTRRKRAAPITPAAVRASAGGLLHIPVARVTNLTRALEHLKDLGFSVAGLDHRADADIYSASPARPLALVVGSEGTGLSRLVAASCDVVVAIPLAGRTPSLNAASALAVGLFAYALRPPG